MRNAAFLFPLLLAGCATGGQQAARTDRLSMEVVPSERIDTPPRLEVCGGAPARGAGHSQFLIVPVRFEVAPDGSVVPGSAQAVGRIQLWTGPHPDQEVVRALQSNESVARRWAQQRAESCTFEPAKRNGEAVAVKVQHEFHYAG